MPEPKHAFRRGDVVVVDARGEFYPGTRGVVTGLGHDDGDDLIMVRVCGEHMPFGDYELTLATPFQRVDGGPVTL